MRRSPGLPLCAIVLLSAGALAAPPNLAAQHDVEMRGRIHGTVPPPGYYDVIARDPTAYEFKTALIPWARGIMERRQQAAARMDLNFLNGHFRSGPGARAAAASAASSAVSGTIRVPSIIFKFSNTTNPSLPDSLALATKLYSSPVPPTYSATTYYDEISRSMLTLDGDILGPYTVTMPDNFYEGSCNGLPGACGDEMLGALLIEVLDAAEAAGVDFSPYDFDSDGQVDFVAFLHPELGGECGNVMPAAQNNIWSHRFVLSSSFVNGSVYTTDDAGTTIDDYIIQGAVGGSTACADSTTVMPIGTFSHETGHAFDIPDLYDTSPSDPTDGIGHWGLMGSGNWNIQESPAHMTAWSLFTLGWIAVDTLQPGTGVRALTVTPIFDSDTAWAVCTASVAANCLTEEYFLLENRTPQGADVNVKVPAADGAGLLIWHIDAPRIASRTLTNSVNASAPYAHALEQADGLNELHTFGAWTGQRGDTGDPWPGSTNATAFGDGTTPNSKLNDGSDSNVFLDNIAVQPDMSITLSVSTGVEHVVTTNREGITNVLVDGVSGIAPVAAIWGVGTTHTIAVPDTQENGPGNERYVFQSWSDVAPPTNSHMVTAFDVIPDTFTATMSRQTLLNATATAGGSVSLDLGSLPYWADTSAVATLTATADVNGIFDAFTGDTTTANTQLVLNMNTPWLVVANFLTPVTITSTTLAPATMGFSGYADTLDAAGGTGTFTWTITSGALPQGMSLDGATGAVSGIPEATGTVTFVAEATSTGINVSRTGAATISITVNAPSLALNSVVDELLGSTSVLSQGELRYLDLLGNDNGRYDVGDFRAFLVDTGQLSIVATSRARDEKAAAAPSGSKNESEEGNEPKTDGPPQRRSQEEGV